MGLWASDGMEEEAEEAEGREEEEVGSRGVGVNIVTGAAAVGT